jgi:putative methyltransferase (TIGR04325 family)
LKIKSIVKNIAPPVLRRLVGAKQKKAGKLIFAGNYATFEDAAADAGGYDDERIVVKVKDALLQVKNGTAKYERDAVLFDKVQYSWPLLAIFQHVALQNNSKLSVLDFGGSLGSTYFQNIQYFKHIDKLDWKIVEQELFVENGRKYFEDNSLKFFLSIEEALMKGSPDVLLFSGVLQCLPKPYEVLQRVLQLGIEHVVFDRTSFIRDKTDRITVQHVNESINPASYPCTFFNEEKFRSLLLTKYDLVSDFDSYAEVGSYLEDGKKVYWKGFYFRLK